MTPHPSEHEEWIAAAALGEPIEDRWRQVLRSCPECIDGLARLRSTAAELDAVAGEMQRDLEAARTTETGALGVRFEEQLRAAAPVESSARGRTMRWIALAAAVLALVAAGYHFGRSRDAGRDHERLGAEDLRDLRAVRVGDGVDFDWAALDSPDASYRVRVTFRDAEAREHVVESDMLYTNSWRMDVERIAGAKGGVEWSVQSYSAGRLGRVSPSQRLQP